MSVLIFLLNFYGSFILLCSLFPTAYKGSEKALLARSEQKPNVVAGIINDLAGKFQSYVSIDVIEKSKISSNLYALGIGQTPEYYKARIYAKACVYAVPFLFLGIISPVALIMPVFVGYQVFSGEKKKLSLALQKRRQLIERELPQFASTIRQSLNTTRNLIYMLESYRKVCGSSMQREIEITLNDMRTGNAQKALKSLDGRVASSKLSELVRGLISLDNGEDVKTYFDMLTAEYQKMQNEEVRKELLLRPKKLNKNMAALFACLAILTLLAVGMMIATNVAIML